MGMDSVVQFTRLFDSIFDETTPIDLVENIYIFCLTWSLGGHLDEKGSRFEPNLPRCPSFSNKDSIK